MPTLIDGDGPPLVQSLAILEYLEEKYPQSPLLPADLHARAHARGLAQMLAMDAHPFIVPRVRKYLEQELHHEEPARMRWLTHWLDAGSRAIEDVLARDPRTGRFCCGDHPTIADICLGAHLTSTKMLCDRSPAPYPTARCMRPTNSKSKLPALLGMRTRESRTIGWGNRHAGSHPCIRRRRRWSAMAGAHPHARIPLTPLVGIFRKAPILRKLSGLRTYQLR